MLGLQVSHSLAVSLHHKFIMKSLSSMRCVSGRDVSSCAEDDLAMKDALDSSSLRAVLVAAVYLASSVRSVRSQAVQEMRGGYVENCRNKRRETIDNHSALPCFRMP